MSLYFDKVRLLTYSHTPVFFDAGLRYKIEKTLTIQGYLLDKTNVEGVNAIVSKEQHVIDAANDYEEIILEGISFGFGKINRINFDGGTLVREEDYTYEIVCYEDGNLFNATAGVYAGLTWPNANLIDSLTENFDYSEDKEGEKSYTHSVTVKLNRFGTVPNGINIAKAIAQNFFNSTSGLGAYLYKTGSLTGGKKLYTEGYNLIEASCSFSETVTVPANPSTNYSYSLNYTLQLGADGFVTIEESLSIKGLTTPPYGGARTGYDALTPGSYTRSQAVYAAYGFSDAVVFDSPISRGVTTNKFAGTIDVSTVFTNDPKYKNKAIWTYTIELTKDAQNYYTVAEKGAIKGLGRQPDQFGNAKTFYTSTVLPGVDTRLNNLYNTTGRALALTLIGQSFGTNEYEGTVEYSFTKTDNSLYSSGPFKKREVEVNTTNPVHLTQKYGIFNFNEIVQTQVQSTVGQKSVSVRLIAKRGTDINTYITEAKNIALSYKPTVPDTFLQDASYEFNPNESNFSMNLVWAFTGVYKSINDLKID